MLFFYDTETTGLPDFKAPSDAPQQPHLVQFAGILVDPVTGAERASIDLIIKPSGWRIPAEVSAIHGITTEMAQACGVEERVAVELFLDLRAQAAVEVAHNIRFDRRIMRIAIMRHMGMTREEIAAGEGGATFCTMQAATPIVKLPPTDRMRAAGFTRPKPPKLSECVRHFFDEDLEGAHNALVDVRACARVYFHLQDMERAAA